MRPSQDKIGEKAKVREQLKADVEKWIEEHGPIEVLPIRINDDFHHNETKKQRERRKTGKRRGVGIIIVKNT